MLMASAMALPLTASITYAESIAPEPPTPPAAPSVSVAPPAPPAPPAPLAVQAITEVDPDIDVEVEEEVETDGDENVVVWREERETDDGKVHKEVRKMRIVNRGEKMSEEEMEAMMAELRAELAEADAEVKGAMKEVEAAVIELRTAEGMEGRTVVKMECRGNSDEVAKVEEGEGDSRTVYLCQSRVMAHALNGLKEARKAIANNPEIEGEMRRNVLEELDRQIEAWKKESKEG